MKIEIVQNGGLDNSKYTVGSNNCTFHKYTENNTYRIPLRKRYSCLLERWGTMSGMSWVKCLCTIWPASTASISNNPCKKKILQFNKYICLGKQKTSSL